MARLTVKTVDGWPLMAPLDKKEDDLLKRNLAPGERVLGQVIGSHGQAVVATDHKVLVVKTEMMAGQTFGGKATSFDYRNLVGVEVRTGWALGEFEIIAAAHAPRRSRVKDRVDVKESPSGLVFNRQDARYFDAMAAKIREMTGAAHAAGTAVRPQTAPPATAPSIPDQIRALAELHAVGILTDDEFTAKKAELLARM
jgi:hypothetical protein